METMDRKGAFTMLQFMLLIAGIITLGFVIYAIILPSADTLASVSDLDKCALGTGGDGRCFPTDDCGGKPGWGAAVPLGCEKGHY